MLKAQKITAVLLLIFLLFGCSKNNTGSSSEKTEKTEKTESTKISESDAIRLAKEYCWKDRYSKNWESDGLTFTRTNINYGTEDAVITKEFWLVILKGTYYVRCQDAYGQEDYTGPETFDEQLKFYFNGKVYPYY